MIARLAWSLWMAGAALAQSSQILHYAPRQNALLTLETPAGAGPFRTVLTVHGGGWYGGSRADSAPFCRVVIETGLACAAVDYRLAPDARFPSQIDDLRTAIAFLQANSSRYGLDPRGLILAGESAGGHLVCWLALTPVTGQMPILGVVAFAPPLDLPALAEPGRRIGVIPPELRDLLGIEGWSKEEVRRMTEASPAFRVHSGAPPFLIVHGDADRVVPVAPSESLCLQLRASGSSCELVRIPGAHHGLWNEDQFDHWKNVWLTTFIRWIGSEIPR